MQIALFSKYTPTEIAKAWNLKSGAVYHQSRKARAALARGTAAVDTANNTSDAGCVVGPGPDLCVVKLTEPCGEKPGHPQPAEGGRGGSEPNSTSADSAASIANNRLIQQTIPEPPRRRDGKVDWMQLSQEYLIKLFSTYSPNEVAEAFSITRPAVNQQIRKLKLAATHGIPTNASNGAITHESAPGQVPISRMSPILPNLCLARITWPSSKADFLQDLWDIPATQIAKRLECSQSMVLTKAKEWNLPRPGFGYFQRKNKRIQVEMSQEAKERLAELRSEEAAAAKRTMEESPVPPPVNGDGKLSPPVAKVQSDDESKVIAGPGAPIATGEAAPTCVPMAAGTSPTPGISTAVVTVPPVEFQAVAQVPAQDSQLITSLADQPYPSGDGKADGNSAPRRNSPARTCRFKAEWPSKAMFLEMLWGMPATKIGKLLGVSDVAVAKRAKALGLETPDHSYRTKMSLNLKVEMPERIQQKLQILRREDAASKPVLVSTTAGKVDPALSSSIEPQTPTTAVESEEVPEPGFPTAGPGTASPFEAQRDFVLFRPVSKHTFSHTSSNAESHPDPDSKPQTNINNASHEKSKC
jgi:hypothetical protein